MSFSFSWVEMHGALTHFPITLLILICALDFGSFLLHKPKWRESSLLLLWIAVVMSPPVLLSGYFTGREYARPPVGFEQHWMVALITSVLALALLVWRVWSRDQLGRGMRVTCAALTAICAATVSYTGYMGGQMVFGDRAGAEMQDSPIVQASAAPDNAKLNSAAGKLETAATKLQTATDKLATSVVQTPPSNTAPPPSADTSNIEQAAARLERVAGQFEGVAEKLSRLAQRLPQSKTPAAETPKRAATATKPAPASSSRSANVPVAAAPTAKPSGLSVQLVSAGEKLFRSDDNGCLSCHKLNGEGRSKGPDLTHAAQLHGDLQWQIEHLKDPEKMVPGSRMPAYDNLTPAELKALATFLISLK